MARFSSPAWATYLSPKPDISCSGGGFKWYAFSTIKNESRARGHSLCASETVAAFLNRDKDRQRIERGNIDSQHRKGREKRKRVEVSDDDESDGKYRCGGDVKWIKQELEEVMRRSKVDYLSAKHWQKRLMGSISRLLQSKDVTPTRSNDSMENWQPRRGENGIARLQQRAANDKRSPREQDSRT